jgi:anthraniloyl-CoA monooxygenase
MRVTIVGGGPAGLYFAILMKRLDPRHDITVFERDGRHDTFGWGIVFSDRTFAYLRESDEPSHDAVVGSCERWEHVHVVHRGQRVSIGGNTFSAIARLRFLNILQDRCEALGVTMRFGTPVADARTLAENCDLLVGADGAGSLVRQTWQDQFEPVLGHGRNKYIWLGTPRLFDGLTLTFREDQAGLFIAHSYRFSPAASTFIVECGPAVWESAGFARMSERETCARLERVFADDLAGEPLLTNNFVRWLNFVLVRNRRWSHRHIVLLGDALHTAHFSIGSGTRLALEDAIALSRAIQASGGAVSGALTAFERDRRPLVETYQDAALESLAWFEHVERDLALAPVPFAYELMTRSGRIDRDKLRRRDPRFVEEYERVTGLRP